MTIVLAATDVYLRQRLRRRLEKITGVSVVGESANSTEVTAMILNRNPDVAIMSSRLDGGSGIDVLLHVRLLMIPPTTIVLTDNSSYDHKNAYAVAGADFIFEKDADDRQVINAIRLLCVTQCQMAAVDSPFAKLDD